LKAGRFHADLFYRILARGKQSRGIMLLDHVIVGGDAGPFSFYANGRLP
jgi:hypothetical protein